MKSLAVVALTAGAIFRLHAQGYIVPNGITYAGTSLGPPGYGITVIHDPTNRYSTGFTLDPKGKTPPGATYTNTYQFDPIVDVSVRVFLVSPNDPVSLQTILAHSYTELMYPNTYVFDEGSPFYLGLYTGNQNFHPPDGIYSDPLFG